MMKYRILLADVDGTLLDFHRGEAIAIAETFRRFGIEASETNIRLYAQANDAQWKKLERGETTQERLRVERFVEFLKLAGQAGDPDALSEEYMIQLGQQRWPLDGAERLCREVSRHMPIELVTNGIARIQRSRLADCVITPYVTDIIISEEVGCAKPDPAMLYTALDRAGINPCDAVLLGDSVTADIAAARRAGIDSILFTNGREAPENHGATWAVKTLEEATRLILQDEKQEESFHGTTQCMEKL